METHEIPKEADEYGNMAGHNGSVRLELEGALATAQEKYLNHPDGSAEKAQARHDILLIEYGLNKLKADTEGCSLHNGQVSFVTMF